MNAPQFETLEFGNMAIGMQFFDTVSGENFRKVSDTHGVYLTGGDAFEGKTVYFGMVDKFETKTPIGYQISDENGNITQGSEENNCGYTSWEILTRSLAQTAIDENQGASLQLFAIYPGDVENPDFLGAPE